MVVWPMRRPEDPSVSDGKRIHVTICRQPLEENKGFIV